MSYSVLSVKINLNRFYINRFTKFTNLSIIDLSLHGSNDTPVSNWFQTVSLITNKNRWDWCK